MSVRPIAILGGTFDPVHHGHLRAAWEAAETLDAEVRLMPASVPPHRPPPVASARERVAMLRAAIEGQDRLVLDTRELDREGPSYTVDTLRDLRRELGPRRSLVLLIGADAFAGLPTWHQWRELFTLAHIGVLTRPGDASRCPPELGAERAGRRGDPSVVGEHSAGRIIDLAVTPLDISASQVRAVLARGDVPRYLVPPALLDDEALLAPYRSPSP